MTELLPCPFCGGRPVRTGGIYNWIECETCVAKSCQCSSTEKATELWNRRTPGFEIPGNAPLHFYERQRIKPKEIK